MSDNTPNDTPEPRRLAVLVGGPIGRQSIAAIIAQGIADGDVVAAPDDNDRYVIPPAPKTVEGLRALLDLSGAPYRIKFDGGNLAVLNADNRIVAYAGSLPKSVSVEEINRVIGLANSMAEHPSNRGNR